MGSMADLECLRAARQGVDEGLITMQDYDVVKVAFLRAQQIKAGLDAGLIRQEDYEKARDAYLNALDFSVMAARPSGGGPACPLRASASFDVPGLMPGMSGAAPPADNGPVCASAAPPALASKPRVPSSAPGSSLPDTGNATPAGSGGGNAPAAAGPPSAPMSANGSGRSSSAGGPALLGSGSGGGDAGSGRPRVSGGSQGNQYTGLPADCPQYSKGATAGKFSMAGIGIDEDCVNLFMHMKTRSAYKWMTYKIDDSGKTVVPDRVGGKSSQYEEFVSMLPSNECRYGVFDYEHTSPERGTFNKIVFVNWAPETAHIKTKMMYASTKDFFKGFLEGTGAELQASEESEVSEEELKARVVANLSRK